MLNAPGAASRLAEFVAVQGTVGKEAIRPVDIIITVVPISVARMPLAETRWNPGSAATAAYHVATDAPRQKYTTYQARER
ncbi:hypothetical protein GALL_224990 [mine drainage metagenome]|uniref:Uncharacterized protein n=1 Tax=mine drainage metagenome TaxID=410659 RepID=A0A1J5RJA4_9ZZZZ